jgi:hypothetical protein
MNERHVLVIMNLRKASKEQVVSSLGITLKPTGTAKSQN